MSFNESWVEKLKVGDTVVVDPAFAADPMRLDSVARLTATQIVLKHDGSSRWDRKTGRRRGDSLWRAAFLREATPELVAAVRGQNAIALLRTFPFWRLEGPDAIALYEHARTFTLKPEKHR